MILVKTDIAIFTDGSPNDLIESLCTEISQFYVNNAKMLLVVMYYGRLNRFGVQNIVGLFLTQSYRIASEILE